VRKLSTAWVPGGDSSCILKTPVRSGNRTAELGELFTLDGDLSSAHLQIRTDRLILDALGLAMHSGSIELIGDGGDAIGQDMRGGALVVRGSVGDSAGAGMRGGQLAICGQAGNYLGAVSANSGRGMRGGDILALSDVGDHVGASMRRGIIYIGGSSGAFGANRMIAGTIIVMKKIGAQWAGGMKRGTIILGQPAGEEWAALLSDAHMFELSFLPILWKYLKSQGGRLSIDFPTTRWASRQIGDLSRQGRGEVLTLARTS
jgi:formylmethanofuran dehydrogenase subunit C